MQPVEVRFAAVEDAHAIAEVRIGTWRSAYRGIVPDTALAALSIDENAREWVDRLRRENSVMDTFVAVAPDGRVVGYASCGPRRDGPGTFAGELYAIYVLDDAQGHGAGRALVRRVARRLEERGMPSMLLWVFEENTAGRAFYERLGGRLVGRQSFELGGKEMVEVAYGWEDTTALRGE